MTACQHPPHVTVPVPGRRGSIWCTVCGATITRHDDGTTTQEVTGR